MNPIIDFINLHRDRYVDELKAYLAIPSISALPAHAADIRRCAEWSAEDTERIGTQLDFKGRIEREDWVGQAKRAHAAKYGETI